MQRKVGPVQLDAVEIAGWVAGAGVFAAGLWVLGSRKDLEKPRQVWRFSVATRAVLGLSLMIAGYHIAAYVSPSGWFRLRVPIEKAWIMGAVMVVAVGTSLFLDRKERVRGPGVSGLGDGGGGAGPDA
jgi:hypothetical protein